MCWRVPCGGIDKLYLFTFVSDLAPGENATGCNQRELIAGRRTLQYSWTSNKTTRGQPWQNASPARTAGITSVLQHGLTPAPEQGEEPIYVGTVNVAQGGPDNVHGFETMVDLGGPATLCDRRRRARPGRGGSARLHRQTVAKYLMRTLHIRHPAMRCVAEALLDLFPSGADISEIGTDAKPCLFVGWRTSGTAGQPGNIAWGVHYRFEAEALSLFDIACEPAQAAALRTREGYQPASEIRLCRSRRALVENCRRDR